MVSAKIPLVPNHTKGWGPVASRRSCEYCHSGGYSHGHSRNDMEPVRATVTSFLFIHLMLQEAIMVPIDQLTTFTMLQAVEPFLPPVDPKQIKITWHDVTSMPSGLSMQFPDGEEVWSSLSFCCYSTVCFQHRPSAKQL